jgi:hypothetical protein
VQAANAIKPHQPSRILYIETLSFNPVFTRKLCTSTALQHFTCTAIAFPRQHISSTFLLCLVILYHFLSHLQLDLPGPGEGSYIKETLKIHPNLYIPPIQLSRSRGVFANFSFLLPGFLKRSRSMYLFSTALFTSGIAISAFILFTNEPRSSLEVDNLESRIYVPISGSSFSFIYTLLVIFFHVPTCLYVAYTRNADGRVLEMSYRKVHTFLLVGC